MKALASCIFPRTSATLEPCVTPLDPILVHPGGCDAAGPPFPRTYMGHASPRFGGDRIIEVGPSL